MTKGPGKKKTRTIKGSPFGNLRCGAILEHGPDAGKPCGEGFFRVTYTGVANGYTDERSLKATGEDTGEFLEKYSYSYPVWRCKRKAGEQQDAPPRNGSPDQKMYCRSKKGCMSDEEKKAANERCPSETYYECALEQSFMELLYRMKRDYEQHGDASMIVTLFDNAFEQAMKQAKNNSISVQRLQTVNSQIEELEERLQDAVSHQVAALREAALEDNAELKDALSNGEVTIDDIDTRRAGVRCDQGQAEADTRANCRSTGYASFREGHLLHLHRERSGAGGYHHLQDELRCNADCKGKPQNADQLHGIQTERPQRHGGVCGCTV